MGMWDNFGVDALGNIVGAGVNLAVSSYNRKENYKYNEMAANNADKRLRDQFRDLYSYPAQVEQMKKAGLNPALMYSGGASGQGGATAPQGLGAGGVQAGYTHFDPMNMAEIEVMKSQANLNNAEAENVNKDTEKKSHEILNLIEQNGYIKVSSRLTAAQADLAECNADLAWETYMANLQNAFSTAEHAANIARSSGVQADLDESTFTAAYQQAWADLNNTLSSTALNHSEIKLNAEEIKKIGADIWAQQWRIHYEGREQNRQDLRLSYDKQYMEQQISKWLREQNQWVEEMKLKGFEIKVDFLSDVLGYVFNLGGISLTNAAKPTKEVSTETIVNEKGQITTKSRTTSRR